MCQTPLFIKIALDNRVTLVVQVQRPGIGESIAVDMLLLRRLMKAVDGTALPALGISQPLVPLVDEFAARLFAELDYIQVGSLEYTTVYNRPHIQ
jgi:predicted unusual protein kinase regulating ubiquinone biosynthesis (AarF/ABC1/UbiB family)